MYSNLVFEEAILSFEHPQIVFSTLNNFLSFVQSVWDHYPTGKMKPLPIRHLPEGIGCWIRICLFFLGIHYSINFDQITHTICCQTSPQTIYKTSSIFGCLNFWDKAWWFLSLRVFGLLSTSLLLFPQRFGRYILQPSSGVCRTWEPTWNFELYWIYRGRLFWFSLTITGYKC